MRARMAMLAWCVGCNALDGADQYKVAETDASTTDGAPNDSAIVETGPCPSSCLSAAATCAGPCATTRDTCLAGCQNQGCKKNCDNAYASCTAGCTATCKMCSPNCNMQECANPPPVDASADVTDGAHDAPSDASDASDASADG